MEQSHNFFYIVQKSRFIYKKDIVYPHYARVRKNLWLLFQELRRKQ